MNRRVILIIIGSLTLLGIGGWLTLKLPSKADTPTSNPGQVEDLGNAIYSSHIARKALFRDQMEGHPHLLTLYDPDYAVKPYRINNVNLHTGEVRSVDGSLGRPSPQGTLYHSNGKIYISSSSPSYLVEYDPATGISKQLQKLADTAGYILVEGDDKAIYIGGATKGYLERYDPATNQYTNYGVASGNETTRWVYYLGADNRYIYAAVGQYQWYLVVYDRQTNQQVTYWDELDPKRILVLRGGDGLYAQRIDQDNKSIYARLVNGAPSDLASGVTPPRQIPSPQDRYCGDTVSGCSKKYVDEIDMSQALPDSANAEDVLATYRWRPIGDPNWKSAIAPIPVKDQELQQLFSSPDGSLLGLASFYGPIIKYNPVTNSKSSLGISQRNIYDVVSLPDQYKIFMAGYPSSMLKYDTQQPWNVTPDTQPTFQGSNPFQLKTYGKYIYFATAGNDGLVYGGVHHERDSVGGEIAWYDPKTEATGSLREPFTNYNIRDLKPALKGSKMVYLGVPRTTATAVGSALLVFDVATKQVERTIVPIPGNLDAYKVMEIPSEPGFVFGLTFRDMFKVNIMTGEIVYTKPLNGLSFTGTNNYTISRLVSGPDGAAWFSYSPTGSTARFITRIDPVTGELKQIKEVDGLANMVFHYNQVDKAYDLYLYGGSKYGNRIRRIKGMVEASPRAHLTISTSASKSELRPGDQTTIQVTVKNEGDAPASNVRVSQPIPEGTEYVSSSNSGANQDGQAFWAIDSLAVGESLSYSLTVRVK